MIGNSLTPNKESVGIDSKGGTGYQSGKIFSMFNTQECGIVGQNCIDLVYLIGQSFAQDTKIKNISDGELWKIGEHFLTCHSGMGREDGVGAISTNRKRTAQQVANAALKGVVVGTVVDR